jgi:hypothetical protein
MQLQVKYDQRALDPAQKNINFQNNNMQEHNNKQLSLLLLLYFNAEMKEKII